MNEFFHKLFSKVPHPTESHKQPNPVTAQDHSAHATRYQLVQMVLRTIMRKYAIPMDWIELREVVVPAKTQGLGMHIRLVVRHWDPNLMNHAQALQNQMLSDIKRYEPNWKEWLHGIAWQLEMSGSCPYTTLPDRPLWAAPEQPDSAAPAPAAAAAPATPPAATHAATAPPAAHMAPAVPVVPAVPVAPATPIAAASAAAAAAPALDTPAEPVAPAPSRQGSDQHTTLERLFAIRDQELREKVMRQRQQGQTGFEDTQPLDEDEGEDKRQDDEPSELARIDLPASRPAAL